MLVNACGLVLINKTFVLLPLGSPEQVQDCAIKQKPPNAVEVSCSKGYQGGLDTNYSVFIHTMDDKSNREQILNDTIPVIMLEHSHQSIDFNATGLHAGSAYIITINSTNKFGTSESEPFNFTFNDEPNTSEDSSPESFVYIFIIFISVVVVFTLIAAMVAIIIGCYRSRNYNILPKSNSQKVFHKERSFKRPVLASKENTVSSSGW